jgi:hypothetical protein
MKKNEYVNEEQPLAPKLGETTLVLVGKTKIEVDPEDGEDFYAYDFQNSEPGMSGTIDMYVAVTGESTREFNELQLGQRFKLIPTK